MSDSTNGFHAYYDVETTGLDAKIDQIVEVSAGYYYNECLMMEFTSLVNPGEEVVNAERSQKAFQINQISKWAVLKAPTTEHVAETLHVIERRLRKRLGYPVRHAYNNKFDMRFLSAVPWGLDDEWGDCVMLLATERLTPGRKWLKLEEAADKLELKFDGTAHRAGPDMRMAARVHHKLEA